ncbi:DUF4342 domain-containing protein [Intestinibacter bartlettii]|uniref:DUF4342 domain-containing protein n=1 Tax=Intestinibacter bartlettii TaxID=261299 RepID=A0ABS6DXC4_9FIRM|nr:DUF4342 domain-containing protein [Intestinibacter bartlettii]MBU5336501.1 DUF4342 domain-containing protein [Intestinibacter bartlettii]MDO5010116.1 DUF4342 domain-containing protein [Intestinibacter bartlettii]
MSQVTIEAIDKVLERLPKATYKQAKEALQKTDGNVVEAIIYLESTYDNLKGSPKKTTEIFGKNTEELKEQVLDLIKKSNVIRLIVERNGDTMLNIPLTVGVVGVIIGPMLTLVGLSAAVLSKCKIKIANEEGDTVIDLGEFSEEKFNTIKDMVSTKAKDVKTALDKNKESNTYPNNETKKDDDEIVISLDKKSYEVKDEKNNQ